VRKKKGRVKGAGQGKYCGKGTGEGKNNYNLYSSLKREKAALKAQKRGGEKEECGCTLEGKDFGDRKKGGESQTCPRLLEMRSRHRKDPGC